MKDFFTKIDDYIDQSLSKEESNAFEKALEGNNKLQEEVQLHRLEREAVLMMLQKEFKGKIKTWRTASANEKQSNAKIVSMTEKKEEKQIIVKQSSLIRRLSIAASVLFFITAGSLFFISQKYTPTALSQSNYMLADTGGDKGGSSDLTTDFQAGLTAFFSEKNHEKAEKLFSKIKKNKVQYIDAQYYMAHSSFRLSLYDKAVVQFQKVLDEPNLPAYMNRSKIEWNQILAMLANGQKGGVFEKKLDKIAEQGQPPFKQKAVELKADLNSFFGKVF